MNTFLLLAQERHSTRTFSSNPIEEEKLQYIIQCARVAPSAVNRQPWHIYIVRTSQAQKKLQQTYTKEWFRQAPLYFLITICHDQSWHRSIDNKDHGDLDIAIATEHICLAATEQGLATCWVCNFDAPLLHSLLNLPSNEEAAVIIPIGYASPNALAANRTTRKEVSQITTEI